MSGPALKQLSSHEAIHNASLDAAISRVDALKEFARDDKTELKTFKEACQEYIEFIEGRIMAHAESEEEENGLYSECEKEHPELHDAIQQLKRDHNIMGQIILKMKNDLESNDIDRDQLVHYASSILVVNEIHSRDEELKLLK